ncbi:MAG: response regulator, partial [Thermodesulfobacteriota bacterium]
MPHMDGIAVLRKLRSEKPLDGTYVIMVTALDDKEKVVQGFGEGADDYIVKPFDAQELKARLMAGLRIVTLTRRLEARVAELKNALDHIKTLQGIIPICMYCHKIRSETECWHRLEAYLANHSEATFSHGICPDCMEKYHPEVDLSR